MKRLAGIAVFLAAASLILAADDPAAPLARTKQELKQLQRDEAAKKSGAADEKLKGALPALNTPMPGQGEPNLSTILKARQDESARNKPGAKKNWLLDGYDKLDDKGRAARAKAAGKKTGAEDEELIDPNDPDYVLKTYDKQKKEAATEEGKPAKDQSDAATARNDPLAPFLQGWLANSPVRDAALAAAGQRDGRALSAGGAEQTLAPSGEFVREGAGRAQAQALPALGADTRGGAAAPNPFLQALALPVPGHFPDSSAKAPAGVAPPVLPVSRPAGVTSRDTLPPPRNDARKAPPSQRDEDKKYFPQLKRF